MATKRVTPEDRARAQPQKVKGCSPSVTSKEASTSKESSAAIKTHKIPEYAGPPKHSASKDSSALSSALSSVCPVPPEFEKITKLASMNTLPVQLTQRELLQYPHETVQLIYDLRAKTFRRRTDTKTLAWTEILLPILVPVLSPP